MKNILFYLLLIPSLSFCQDISLDSLKKEVMMIKADQKHIKISLQRHSKQFGLGVAVVAAGAAVLIAGKSEEKLLYVGGGLLVIGTVIQFDSHKWIGRAGKKKR